MDKLLLLLTVLVWGATAAAFAARAFWMCELATHFRAQYAALLMLSAAGLLFLHHPAWAAAAGLGGAINLAILLPTYGRMTLPSRPQRPGIKALLMNVNFRNQDYESTLNLIHLTRPEFVAIIEVTRVWQDQLAPLREIYPYTEGVALRSGWGMLLLSRLPFQHSRTVRRRERGIPYVLAEVQIKGRPVTIILTHPYAPSTRRQAHDRNRQFDALARIVSQVDPPVLVFGDLNCSPWSPFFSRLLRATGLRDSRHGFGLQPTWPARNPLLGIPIDHCLVSPEITVHDRRVGPGMGSDHWPVFVEFSVESA